MDEITHESKFSEHEGTNNEAWNKKIKFRMRMFGVIAVVAFAVLGTRLYYIQIEGHEALSEAAFKQQTIRLILTDFELQEASVSLDEMTDAGGAASAGETFEYLYLIKRDKLASMGARENEYHSLMAKMNGEQLCGAANEYVIYGSHLYNDTVGDRLKNKFGALVIKDADKYGDDLIYAYADRDGNFLNWMPIIQL